MTGSDRQHAGAVQRWLRDPVVLFFALGVLLFVAWRYLGPEEVQPVTLSAASEAIIVAEFEALTGRRPTAAERERLIAEHYRREVLYREGLAVDLPRSDPALRDAVIERMQQRVSGEFTEPEARELVSFYSDNIERYYSEATISFEQRFFAAAPTDAGAILAALRRGEPVQGDTAWQGRTFPRYGLSMIRGLFGQKVLDTLQSVNEDSWAGPYESPDGWHYLRVTERRPAVLLPYERVREQVLADYQAAALERRLDAFVESRRDRYPLQRER